MVAFSSILLGFSQLFLKQKSLENKRGKKRKNCCEIFLLFLSAFCMFCEENLGIKMRQHCSGILSVFSVYWRPAVLTRLFQVSRVGFFFILSGLFQISRVVFFYGTCTISFSLEYGTKIFSFYSSFRNFSNISKYVRVKEEHLEISHTRTKNLKLIFTGCLRCTC